MVTFDPVEHKYYDKHGIEVPGVTSILKAVGRASSFYNGTEARDRGTSIHAATWEMDTLGTSPADYPELEPWLIGWETFIKETGAKVLMAEEVVDSDSLHYAGTLDRVLIINVAHVVTDLKTGSPAPWHAEQIAAYAIALREKTCIEYRGLIVYLDPKKALGFSIKQFNLDEMASAGETWREDLAKYKEQRNVR
jgi:hypothetical protein